MVDTQYLPRRKMMKTLLMTARWRSCFSSRTMQVSDRVNKDCSSSTLTSSGEAGSSTWPQVRRAFTLGLSRSPNMSLYKILKPNLKQLQVQYNIVWEKFFTATFWHIDSRDACWGIVVGDIIDSVCSWADAGWGCGTCEHFGQLDSGGHDYSLHQDAREEEDIWQRQLSVSNRYHLLAIIPQVSMSLWSIWACFCCLKHQRKFGKQQELQLCLWMSSICRLCLRWASVTFALWLYTEGVCAPADFFLHVQRELEEAWGVKVFDRYSVVLHIFRCNARTKEAKLQISLAEIPLLR